MEPHYTAAELAKLYNVTEATLTTWRYKRKGPKWFRAGKRIFYRRVDVEAWEAEQVERTAKSA